MGSDVSSGFMDEYEYGENSSNYLEAGNSTSGNETECAVIVEENQCFLDAGECCGNYSTECCHLNITESSPINYAIPIMGYCMPFLILITIIANTMVVVVLSKRHMRSPTNAVLLTMALSDTLMVILKSWKEISCFLVMFVFQFAHLENLEDKLLNSSSFVGSLPGTLAPLPLHIWKPL